MKRTLNKELCEHERIRSSDKYGNYRHKRKFSNKEDEEVTLESMQYRHNNKEFNENLRPLYGLIEKNVGKNWDIFFSELCKNFDMRGVINNHILQHLFYYIARPEIVKIEGDEIFIYSRKMSKLEETYFRYWVNPITKIICKNEHFKPYGLYSRELKQKEQEEFSKIFKRNGDYVYHLIDSIWYEFKIEKVVLDEDGNEFNFIPLKDKTEDEIRELQLRKFKDKSVYDEYLKETIFFSSKNKRKLNFLNNYEYHTKKKQVPISKVFKDK